MVREAKALPPGDEHDGPMHTDVEGGSALLQSQAAAARASELARVRVVDVHEMGMLEEVNDLLTSIWGTTTQGAPIPLDVLRSISHAGCSVTAAYNTDGEICGAAVAIVSAETASAYSLIAGVRAGRADSGVGYALKQHQRSWALAHGLERMVWTFDPLVSRNARFNLSKLGATVDEYNPNFYGTMLDDINADDESDRLVATWTLAGGRTVACSEGAAHDPALPDFRSHQVRSFGPDERPAVIESAGVLWCRVPRDIVSLRTQRPAEAREWRRSVREALTDAFDAGYTATSVTRTGWYRLAKGVHS